MIAGLFSLTLFSCKNDDEEIVVVPPTLENPDDISMSIGTTATLTFTVNTVGEIASASSNSSSESVATTAIANSIDEINTNGEVVLTVTGLTIGETTITVTIVDRDDQTVSSSVSVSVEEKLADVITAREDLSSLEAALNATQLIETLRGEGPFTIFAPSNSGFDALLSGQGTASLDDLVNNLGVDALSNILQSHLVLGTLNSDDIFDKDVYTSIGGATLTVIDNGEEVLINGAKVVETDIISDNGVIHIIDSVVNLSASSDGLNGFTVTIENISSDPRFFQHGVFNIPIGSSDSNSIQPATGSSEGGVYEFSFYAGPVITSSDSAKLSFALKLEDSFDLFLATDQNGLKLYNNNIPISGDITDQLMLWDANVKDNTSGEDLMGLNPVKVYNGTKYPSAIDLVKVTVSNVNELFTVRIQNVSGASSSPSSISPGVYGVHTVTTPFFATNRSVGEDGLRELALEGDPSVLEATMARNDGVFVPISPGVFAVHGVDVRPALKTGEVDRGQGLESLGEDGNVQQLSTTFSQNSELKKSGIFEIPDGANIAGNLGFGQRYSFTLDNVAPGDYLTIVVKMVQSNDIIYSTPEAGIPLFLDNGRPFNGNASRLMVGYDIGTEKNEYPGAGLNQPIRQLAPDTGGPDDDNTIRRVITNDVDPSEDGFIYRPVGERVKVTITPNP